MTMTHSFYTETGLFGLFLVVVAVMSAILSRRVIALRVLDYPTGRSAHGTPVPKGGGLAILIVFVVGVPLGQLLFHHHADTTDVTLLLATVWLGLFSWRDDMQPMPPTWKLGAQIAAAVLVAWGDMAGAGAHTVTLDGMGVRVMWLIVLCNCLNFMDGLNGLASGCTLLAALVTAGLCAAVGGGVETWGTALVLVAAITGFLPFNIPQARLFMGDVGSQCCGLVLGALGLRMAGMEQLAHGAWLMPLMLSGLLLDVIITLLRRACHRRPLMQAHREHIYQMAQRSGMRAMDVTTVAWAGTICGGMGAVAVGLGWISPVPALLGTGLIQSVWIAAVIRRVRRTPDLSW
ncbi:UDP-phosphate N-acetylglucosaminyl-1-phosphate transferase [Komagataeibacter oboediens]|uniref:UDP-phosphate N-acetylglucosaminyl-1-phosphate transferase n=2 Tax=Komagataeibacter oboediens TaxID=65958 RepID=A0ABS5SHQ8_9PROT|nr:UDP-phosphate N-acetylglucosaminyl-1-phosphate transferase [Komagataeibacter oboediens]MBT0673853.1 UDP-phosphate N-acetylglucosaminyl-1-phosphate transferase [Komagataeibacter oboediens]MBT0677424.1 UDP-phosphate N-acetylglucosaminyl-1-phosphate transferase [Komagataeibacter oboediens]